MSAGYTADNPSPHGRRKMMPEKKGYDSQCHDLAKLFLGDEPALNTEQNAADLAQAIQDAAEDWLSYERDEQVRP